MSDKEIMNLILTSAEEGYCELSDKYTNYVYSIASSVIRRYGTDEDT